MESKRFNRRLSAIMFADAADYSRLMGIDENDAHHQMISHRREVIDPGIEARQGHIVNTSGDGLLVEFPSVIGAVECAVDIQRALAKRNLEIAKDRRLCWRIGINFGDVIVEEDDIYGDGVNIAARLEQMAEPGGICISGAVFREVRNKIDVGFESLGEKWLKNIAEPTRVYRAAHGLARSSPAPARPDYRSPELVADRPSIVVLPFANLTPDKSKQYLVDGLTEDLITDLSMSPEFFVVARTSSFAFKEGNYDLGIVAQRLGVRYVVVGSVQEDNRGFRVSVQLIEAATGIQLWARRYDRKNADLFEVRDEITRSIAATLMTTAGEIAKAELRRQSRKDPENFNIYDHYLKARYYFHRSTQPPWKRGKDYSNLSKAEFTRAIGLSDPPYWPLFAGLAWQYAIDFDWAYSRNPNKSAKLAFDNAVIAVKNAPHDHMAHWVMGWAYLFTKRDYERALYHYTQARELNVGDSRLLAEMAQLLIYTGKHDHAIEQLEQAIRLNPLHEQWYDEFLAWAYEEKGQPEKAIELLSRFDELEGIWSHAILARAYAQTGKLDRFKEQIALMDKMAREQFKKPFSSLFWREWVRQREPYKDSARAERVISVIDEALKQIGWCGPSQRPSEPLRA